MGFRAITPNITINTQSGQLRTELQNTFTRLDGQLQNAPYRYSIDIGPAGNDASATSALITRKITYDTLTRRGSTLSIYISGRTGANANNKTIQLVFGSTTIFTTGAVAFNNSDWSIRAEIVRGSDVSQVCSVTFNATSSLLTKVTTTVAAEDLATNKDFIVNGTGTAASDVVLDHCNIVLIS